jgi:hypothetical protein
MLPEGLRGTAENLPGEREAGNGRKHARAGFLAGAFAIFCFQHPSVPVFQKAAEEREKRNGPRRPFREETIPGTGQARKIWGGVERRGGRGAP